MPKASKPQPETTRDRATEIEELYKSSEGAMQPFLSRWDEQEAMLISRSTDKFSEQAKIKSSVNNARMSTLVYESSARVMAQMPTGRFQAMTKSDKAFSEIIQVVWDRYVIPNARSQFDMLTKYRMWNVYSKVYGSYAMYYDWTVGENYVGPDCWLVPMRNFFPQPGKTSIEDSDWVILRTLRSVRWLKTRRGMEGWDDADLNYVIAEAEKTGKNPSSSDSSRQSYVERNRLSSYTTSQSGDSAQVELITYYEAGKDGHWVTLVPDFDYKIIRDIKNPHENGKIPVILKHCFPLVDSMIGLGDFERGKTLQYASNSLLNMYLDTIKMGLYPPLMINPDQVGSLASIQWGPAAKWLVKNPAAVQPLNLSPQGLNTFQSTWEILNGSILNLMGTTDTTVTQNMDAAYGKTPQAIAAQQTREAARDNWDRFFMEQSIEHLTEAMANLFANKHEVDVDIPIMFKDELKRIDSQFLDEKDSGDSPIEVYDSEEAGMLHLKGGHLKKVEIRFNVDASSTLKREQAAEHESLTEVLGLVLKSPELLQVLQQDGKKLDLGELMKRWLISSGVDDAEKILTEVEGTDPMSMMQSQVAPQVGQLPPAYQPGAGVSDPSIQAAIEALNVSQT